MKTKIIIMIDDSVIDKDSIVHAIEEVTTTGFDIETEVSIFAEELTNLITFDEINDDCKHKQELFDTISKSIDKILNVAIKNTTEEVIPASLLPMYEVMPEEALVELYDIGCEDNPKDLPKDNLMKYLRESGVLEKSEIIAAPIPETETTTTKPSTSVKNEKEKRKVEDELRLIIGGMPHVEEPLYDNRQLTDGGISFMIYDSCYDDYVVRTISKHFPDFDNWKGVFMNHFRFDSSICLEPKLIQTKENEPYNITVITKGSTFPAKTSYMTIHAAQRIIDKVFKVRASYEDLDKLLPLSMIHTVYSATATLDDMTEDKPYAAIKLNGEDYVVASFFASELPTDFDISGKKFGFRHLVCINPMKMIVPASVGYSPIFYIYSRKIKMGKRTLTDTDVAALISLVAKLDYNVNFSETQSNLRGITPVSNMAKLCNNDKKINPFNLEKFDDTTKEEKDWKAGDPYAIVVLNDTTYWIASCMLNKIPKAFKDVSGNTYQFMHLMTISPECNMVVPSQMRKDDKSFYLYCSLPSQEGPFIQLKDKKETERLIERIRRLNRYAVSPVLITKDSEIVKRNGYKPESIINPDDKDDDMTAEITVYAKDDSGMSYEKKHIIAPADTPFFQTPLNKLGNTYTKAYLVKLCNNMIVKADFSEIYNFEFVLYSDYDITNYSLSCKDLMETVHTIRGIHEKSLGLTKIIDGVEYSKTFIHFGIRPFGKEVVGTENDITDGSSYHYIAVNDNETYIIASNKTTHPYNRFDIDGTIFECHAATMKNPKDGKTVNFWLYSPKPLKTEFGTATIFTKKVTMHLINILKSLDKLYEPNKYLNPYYKDPDFGIDVTEDVVNRLEDILPTHVCSPTNSTISTEPTAFLGTSINYDELIKDPSKYNVVNICGIVGLLTRYDVTTFIPFHTGPYMYYIEKVFNCKGESRLEWTHNKTRSSEWVFITNHAINLPFVDMNSPLNEILNSETRMYKYDPKVANSVYSGVAPGVVPVSQLSHIDTLYHMPKTAEGMAMYDKAATESKCIEDLRSEIMEAIDNYIEEKKMKGNDEISK